MTGKRIVGKHGTKNSDKKKPHRNRRGFLYLNRVTTVQSEIEQTFEVKLVGIPIANIGNIEFSVRVLDVETELIGN